MKILVLETVALVNRVDKRLRWCFHIIIAAIVDKQKPDKMQEPWDELMGPSPDDLKNMLRSDPHTSSAPAVRGSSGGAPPSTMFSKSSAPPAAMFGGNNAPSGMYEDDEGNIDIAPSSIRQDALKMLEVADDQLQDSAYAVHRTRTGGFSATPREGKRLPAALSGLGFSKTKEKKEREYPSARLAAAYSDRENDVVDYEGMDSRAAGTQSEKKSTWSSRYSVNDTLMSLSGGAVSSSKLLDKMDRTNNSKTESLARNNLFGHSGEAKNPAIFGSGYSFRKKHVFGKQDVVADDNNLRSYTDAEDGSSMPTANKRNKSWQQQLAEKRRRQRILYLAVLVFGFMLVCSGVGIYVLNNRGGLTIAGSHLLANSIDTEGVSFFVTTGPPANLDMRPIYAKNETAYPAMLVHLGNFQNAVATQCPKEVYEDAKASLEESPLVTFIVPGTQDINMCPDPSDAWTSWQANFRFFHRNFDGFESLHIMDEENHLENFAMVYDDVLFLGMHLVSGRRFIVLDEEGNELDKNEFNLQWIKGMARRYTGLRAMVFMGNEPPSEPMNQEFFDRTVDFLSLEYPDIPVAYIHTGTENRVYLPYEAKPNLLAMEVASGGSQAPLRLVNVGYSGNTIPFYME